MKKLLFSIFVFLMLCSFAFADSYEAITVGATAIGTTAEIVDRASWGMCRLEGAEIRYTKSYGTTPTNTVGIVLEPLEWVILDNKDQLRNFRAIRTGASASLKCEYFD